MDWIEKLGERHRTRGDRVHARYAFHADMKGLYDLVNAQGYKPRLVDLRFEDDPVIAARRKSGAADDDGFEPGKMVVRPVKRDATGVWHVTRDLEMIRE